MKTNFILIFFLINCWVLFAMDNEFVMHEITNSNAEGMEITSIDFDGDGDFDLLSAGLDCTLWLNDGNGNFSENDLVTNTNSARSIRAADLDNDGDNDIVYCIPFSNQVIMMENLGSSFTTSVFDATLVMPHTMDLKDIDQDGDIDIFSCEFDMTNALSDVVWWENLGGLNFSDKIIIFDAFQQSTYVFADFIDSDDHMDIVACCEELSDVMWWQNDGNQNFGAGNMIDPNFFRTHTIIGKDLDQDGDIDILGAACMGGLLAWFENDGEGGFTRHPIDNFGGALWLDCADFDNDGDNDLCAVGQGPNYMCIYENLGDEVFEAYPLPGEFSDGFGEAAADFDNDGDIDVAAIGRSSQQICWWENKYYGADFEAIPQTGNIPLQVQFVDQSNLPMAIDSWAWDFDNDGVIDSNDQYPNWIYEEVGSYSISLEVAAGTNSAHILQEDIVTVFNGHSALEFDGEESHVFCPAESSMNITDAFTIEAWIYPYSYGPDVNFGLGRIFDKSVISIFLNNEFPLYLDQCLVVQMEHADGTLSISTTPAISLQLNQWQHIAVSYDGIDEVRMFVGGYNIMSNQPTAPTGSLDDNGDDDLIIGNRTEFTKSFDGIIDEIRVWNYCMNQNEIQTRMNNYLQGTETGLEHYWQFSEGNGENVFDLAGNNIGIINEARWCQGKELEPIGILINEIQQPVSNLCNYPNPFNPSTVISFRMDTEIKDDIELTIFNLKGQKVKTFSNLQANRSPNHQIIWNGTDNNNQSVSSGIYFYKVKAGKFIQTRKMIMMK